jgi:hypothetical protein
MAGSIKNKEDSQHNVTFAEGGDTPMFGKQAAEPSEAGVTVDKSGKDTAPGPKYAAGGSTKMFGFSPAMSAKAGITSAR